MSSKLAAPPPSNQNAPAFPGADSFQRIHNTVMAGVDSVLEAAEPIAKTVESVASQTVEGLRDFVASVSGKPKDKNSPEL